MLGMMKKAKYFVLWYNTRNTVKSVNTATKVISVFRTPGFASTLANLAARMMSSPSRQ